MSGGQTIWWFHASRGCLKSKKRARPRLVPRVAVLPLSSARPVKTAILKQGTEPAAMAIYLRKLNVASLPSRHLPVVLYQYGASCMILKHDLQSFKTCNCSLIVLKHSFHFHVSISLHMLLTFARTLNQEVARIFSIASIIWTSLALISLVEVGRHRARPNDAGHAEDAGSTPHPKSRPRGKRLGALF